MSLVDIQAKVAQAEEQVGRLDQTQLIAVSKMQPLDRVETVLDQGHRVFGENRVQEAQGKWPQWKGIYPNIELHLLGPLQTNKARAAVELFDVIHSVDRPKLIEKLASLAQDRGACPALFLQINTGEEQQKAGILPGDADRHIEMARKYDLPLCGLMCIPPINEAPSLHFSLLRKIAHRNGLDGLSMGMSADFEEAISFGATHIRVGSAIFGARS